MQQEGNDIGPPGRVSRLINVFNDFQHLGLQCD